MLPYLPALPCMIPTSPCSVQTSRDRRCAEPFANLTQPQMAMASPCASVVGSFSPAFHRMTTLLVLGSCIALESTPMGERVGYFQSSPQLGLHRRHQPAHHPDISSHLLSPLGIHLLPVFRQDCFQGLWTFPSRQAQYRRRPRLQSVTCIRGSLSPRTRSFSTTV